ncbi:L,D-transpeptidase catalytic domain [Marininema mesophilum]|uniref:L,D-transpeptidase catalytic domain n=1 Tax=Marininema mesophilum TaxID=1048340 RepID=A0A1H2W5K7_9BACL|nr:L,D-transpeptidase [Marininema mesophilum]SDW75943.1 L,D-transpeptidase catalytic domain [Marininema mesophilum]
MWIIVDLSERRLYLLSNQTVLRAWPVGIGKTLTRTPIGTYSIVNKQPYPFSHPGGQLSPYGVLWMGLSRSGYGIHGTNNPSSIGKQVSKGCIRMHNRDVQELSSYVPIGTQVTIRA